MGSKADLIIQNNKTLSHNLKSPLAALESLKDNITEQIETDEKILLENTIASISKIAGELIDNKKLSKDEFFNAKDVIETTIKAKLLEIKDKTNVVITIDLMENFVFLKGNSFEFQTILSNIINNSLEAISSEVCLKGEIQNNRFSLSIIDNGNGFDKSNCDKLFDYGFTIGKETGKGLGLAHAKKQIENWAGEIKISSATDQGTVVSITLPFINAITSKTIALIDNERLNHLNWIGMRNKLGIKVITFNSSKDIEANQLPSNVPIFVDFELDQEDGLTVAKSLSKSGFKNVVITTGRSELVSTSYMQISKSFPKELFLANQILL